MPQLHEIRKGPTETVQWDGTRWNPMDAPSGPSTTEEVTKRAILPFLGGMLGGKVGGPIGSGIGAAGGQSLGDLYDMLMSATGHPGHGEIPTPGGEAARLASIAGLTTAGEKFIPPVLRAVGSVMPKNAGWGIGGSALLGQFLGHPGYGAAIGAAAEAAPKVANGIEWMGSRAGSKAGADAAASLSETMSPRMVSSPTGRQAIEKARAAAQQQAGGPFAEAEANMKQWPGKVMDAGTTAGHYIADTATSALKGLKGMASSGAEQWRQWMNPVEQATPLNAPADVAETLYRTRTSTPSVRPDLSRTPSRGWGADVNTTGEWHSPTPSATPPPSTPPTPPIDPFDASGTVGAAKLKGTNLTREPQQNFIPREYPTGTSPSTSPKQWVNKANLDAEAQSDPQVEAALAAKIKAALDGLKSPKGR